MKSVEGKDPGTWLKLFKDTGVLTGAKKSNGEWPAYCPSCEDPDESSSASASFNFKEGKYWCASCQKTFAFKDLLFMARQDAADRRAKAGKVEEDKTSPRGGSLPSMSQVERWHRDLMVDPDCLKKFQDKRGISTETLAKFQVGYHRQKKRYTIPVFDLQGELVNIRYYSMNENSQAKMINHTGHGTTTLFRPSAIEEEEVLLCEGEWDALIAIDRGFNAMTWTSGVASWQDKWNGLFEGKTVFVCFDDDDAGKQGARKVALKLDRAGAKCHIIQLAIENIKGGDLTDYFHSLGNAAGEFREMMEESRHTVAGRVRKNKVVPTLEAEQVSVEDSFSEDNYGKPVEMIGTVHGKAESPYNLPRKVDFTCEMNWGDKCNKCSIQVHGGQRTIEIPSHDPALIGFVDKTEEQTQRQLLKMAGAPPTCPKVDVDKEGVWTTEEIMVMPSVEDRSDEVVNPVSRIIYNVGTHNLQNNKTYKIQGTSLAHPASNKATFQSWSCEPVEVDIERFRMTPEIKEQLEIFQPDEWQEQSAWDKLHEIAYDMSINVTHIYGRPELHIGYDLVWHSVNSFYFGNQLQVRGWVEGMVIGDTRTGKSEASHRLTDHYKSGVVKMADAPSFAGLIGGASQQGTSKSWGITWGTIPLNDRRLVVLDEAGGITPAMIGAMSSVRSSGVADIQKMGGQKTSARTRLIWILNPVTKRKIVEMANGAMDEVPEFVPQPEDIARFEFVMSAAEDDVDIKQTRVGRKASTPHLHNSEDCKLLITWAWSRKAEDVVWVDDTEDYIQDKTEEFTNRYVSDLPLVQKQSFHMKLARLSAAVAARVFSTDETGEKVMVTHEHVDTALRFLDTVYGMDSFGYKAYSRRVILDRQRARRNARRTKDLLWGDDGIRNTLIRVMGHGKFKNRDFEERGGMVREQAVMAVDQLIEYGMLKSMSRGDLKMTPELMDIMRGIRRRVEEELDREAEEENG